MSAVVVIESGADPQGLVDLARGVSDLVVVVALGPQPTSAASSAEETVGARVEANEPDAVAAAVTEVVRSRGADVVVVASTAHLREAMALIAYQLGAACVSDVVSLRRGDGSFEAERLLFGGVAVATMALQRPVVVVSGPSQGAVEAVDVPTVLEFAAVSPRRTLVSSASVERRSVLPSAQRVVSFGRGVRTSDDVKLIEDLARALKAELGCSRPIVEDMRWLGVEHQVGLTGTTVAPELYVAVGISGQIQHLVGMRESKVIVAINMNPSAPIFSVADIGVVGDLYEVVPRLVEAVAKG